ncbi:MAG: HDOD domain-containing protein [Alphaproteobacteria bacterium]|nr:HDOD domain-containing protein [Alphaproteobacteria bacterium]
MPRCSMQEAMNKASVYIDRRIEDGSKIAITLPHASHILIMAVSAYLIARQIKKQTKDETIDLEKAFVCGLLHDIGRYIVDERESKYPHTIAGYDRCKKLKIPGVAPVCLTHAILDKATHEEYPDYTPEQLKFVNDKMSKINRSFYDDLTMLVDLHCRGDQVFHIHDRLEKNIKMYNIQMDNYYDKYMALYNKFTSKYNVDIYRICRFVADHRKSIFKHLMPYCHGWLRYVCGDKSVAKDHVAYSRNANIAQYWKDYLAQQTKVITK